MDIIDELRAFVATAQTGSFTAAADQLGVSNRLTSKYVAELEARLGIRLFQRTTRKVGLTPVGEKLLTRALTVLDSLDEMLEDITQNSRGLSGTIRISAPVTFGEMYVVDMLERFAHQHPDLSFDLRLSDQFTDLASEGIDLAFRLGHSEMQSLKIRKLGNFRSVLVASPDYIKKKGAPRLPSDLSEHSCIVDTNRKNSRHWVFEKGEENFIVKVRGRFHVNSASSAVKLSIRGLGIAYIPDFAVNRALERGSLVPVMEGYDCEEIPLSAVYLEGRDLPRKVRALIDFSVKDNFKIPGH